ncbi:hypothetical protein ACFQAT_27505 [Undibacterium arcticum]|uniref:hypothetical protein n=1 Tax=Undibacterium arcticum TaxID=1762892 RepID=UPI003606CDAE
MGQSTIARAAEIAASGTGKRFCSHHQGEVAADAGSLVQRNKSKRWICNACQAKSRQQQEAMRAPKKPVQSA